MIVRYFYNITYLLYYTRSRLWVPPIRPKYSIDATASISSSCSVIVIKGTPQVYHFLLWSSIELTGLSPSAARITTRVMFLFYFKSILAGISICFSILIFFLNTYAISHNNNIFIISLISCLFQKSILFSLNYLYVFYCN